MSESRSNVAGLSYLAWSLCAAFVIVMAYGIYYFPAAPFRDVDGQYIDKRGQAHSRAELEHLQTWERVYVAAWIAMAGVGVAAQVAKRRARGR